MTAQVSFINYTPHKVVFHDQSGVTEYLPVGTQVRVSETILSDDGTFVTKGYGEITGLPSPVANTFLIVSAMVLTANAASANPRTDLVAPDTGTFVIRNEQGQITGTKRWVR